MIELSKRAGSLFTRAIWKRRTIKPLTERITLRSQDRLQVIHDGDIPLKGIRWRDYDVPKAVSMLQPLLQSPMNFGHLMSSELLPVYNRLADHAETILTGSTSWR